jgi:hypothetical protein
MMSSGDDVHAGEIRDHLQHGAHFDVLEVERQLLAGVAGLGLDRLRLDERLDLDDEAVVGLVGGLLPAAARLDRHARVLALGGHLHRLHRGAEVVHVELALERDGQLGLEQVHDNGAAGLLQVDAGAGIGQVDDDLAFAIAPAPEVDRPHRMRLLCRLALGEVSRLGGGGRHGRGLQRDHHGLPVQGSVEARGLVQVQHHAAAARRLADAHTPQHAFLVVLAHLAQRVHGVRQVERHARRVAQRESGGRVGQRFLELHAHDHLAGLGADIQ